MHSLPPVIACLAADLEIFSLFDDEPIAHSERLMTLVHWIKDEYDVRARDMKELAEVLHRFFGVSLENHSDQMFSC